MSSKQQWELVVGLEVHAQLSTDSKIFSRAHVAFGEPPNSLVNEVCAGLPGALPVLNEQAVELAIRAGLAFGCDIRRRSVFARKNYFYPDLPKGYQISQFEEPICLGGSVPFSWNGEHHAVALTRIHMEEDAGKSSHEGNDPYSHIDLNRAGTPLVEIVSEPDIRDPDEAAEYFRTMREVLVALGVNDGNMAEGSLRCDANISVRPVGEQQFRTRAEVKNLNSFRFLRDAIAYERDRQIAVYETGDGEIVQETRLWDEVAGKTYSMREKEGSADYRYFPDPDLPPLIISEDWIARVRNELPELPAASRRRLQEMGVSADDARTIVAERAFLLLFDACLDADMSAADVVRWLVGPIATLCNADGLRAERATRTFVSPQGHTVGAVTLVEIQALLDENTINLRTARELVSDVAETGKSPAEIVEERGLEQVSDNSLIDDAIRAIAAENEKEAEAFRAGKNKLMGFFMGQVMRRTGGKANPAVVRERIVEVLRG